LFKLRGLQQIATRSVRFLRTSAFSSTSNSKRFRGYHMRVKKPALIFASISLATAFLIAGAKQVTIREFDVPTPKSRPHDPAVAPDGSLWYTGQAANKLGRLDPATQKFKEFPLKTPGSGPHGLVADPHGTTSGSPRSRRGTLASWLPRQARSLSITCRMAPTILTLRF
jgi:hypothetical protein